MKRGYKVLNLGFRYDSVLEFCHIVSYGVTERANRAGAKGRLKEAFGTLDNTNLKCLYNIKYRFF
jgi:hypothetical protein